MMMDLLGLVVGRGIFENSNMLSKVENISGGDVQSLRSPYLAPPVSEVADVPLYLSIERPLHYSSRDLSLRGRILGSPVGTVAIDSILEVLIRSLDVNPKCPGHPSSINVFNIKPSLWAGDEYYKPIGGSFNSYISVKDNTSWALFLAGQTAGYDGKIVLGCVDCAGETSEHGSPLIGYI